ncbi:MAG: hypothetical protein HYT69_01190 [Candidatus Zambryskibacteria bacterium]|nr:hypothetical protein [Candidatus Zambryskibacteria bacterium]
MKAEFQNGQLRLVPENDEEVRFLADVFLQINYDANQAGRTEPIRAARYHDNTVILSR